METQRHLPKCSERVSHVKCFKTKWSHRCQLSFPVTLTRTRHYHIWEVRYMINYAWSHVFSCSWPLCVSAYLLGITSIMHSIAVTGVLLNVTTEKLFGSTHWRPSLITVRLLTHVLCKPTHFFFHSFITTMSYSLKTSFNSAGILSYIIK